MTVPGTVWLISVERNARAVVRPSRAPSLKVSLGDLDSVASCRGHDVQVIPSILIAQKCDPPPVRRRPRLRSRLAPVRNTPKFLFGDGVDFAWLTVASARHIN